MFPVICGLFEAVIMMKRHVFIIDVRLGCGPWETEISSVSCLCLICMLLCML